VGEDREDEELLQVNLGVDWLQFSGGGVEFFLALVLGLVGLAALLYSLAKIRPAGGPVAEYYVFLVLLLLCGIGVVYARNLLVIFAFWEIAAFALWRLVAFYRGDEELGAAVWAWLVNFASAALMLVGLGLILLERNTLDLDVLRGQTLSFWPATLVLVGILAKSATLPLYVWLPRAYKAAPAPVCALLSGVAENIGIILFFKLFAVTMQAPSQFMAMVAGLAVVSSLVAGGVALTARTIRSTLAYSTVSQLGFIFLGLSLTGYYGITAGLLYVAAHAIAKSGLFFAAGLVEDSAGSGELDKLGGAARISPVLALAFGVLALSVIGVPPFLGFFAKLGVVIAAVRYNLWLGVGAMVAALFTLLYLVRLYSRVFMGPAPATATGRTSGFLVGIVSALALLSLAAGIAYYLPIRLIESGMAQSLGGL
jgi:formate hydrogenlyase subunit 3/multisubunit Na+/H+ antiporter MnhD subunit